MSWCRHVSTVTGDTRYFFLALDEEDELVGGSGSPEWPHVATIGKLPNGEKERCAWDGYCGPPSGPIVPTVEGLPRGATDEEQLTAAVRAVRSRYRKTTASTAGSRAN